MILRVRFENCGNNLCATVTEHMHGVVGVTAMNIDELKKNVAESVKFHIEGLVEDGEDIPQWLRDGNYEFEWFDLSI